MDNFKFKEDMMKEVARIKDPNTLVGRGSLMPSEPANSGSRKIMNAVQVTHILPLFKSKAPYLMTGRENKFAQFSSSLVKAKNDYQIVAKVKKFSFQTGKNGAHYYLILYNIKTGMHELYERTSYEYIVESYGYMYNNDFIDSLNPGDYIAEGEIIKKTTAYDEAGNRADGNDVLTMYISDEDTREDAIKISDELVEMYASPDIKPVTLMVNDNHIMLNLYGDENFYQSFPNIGEKVKGCLLCAIREEKNDQAIYSQAVGRLQQVLMSDEKFIAEGEVIDINIYCNDVSILERSHYNAQLLFYYQESMRVARELVEILDPLKASGAKFSPELQKLHSVQKSILSGTPVVNDKGKPFTNVKIDIVVLNRNVINIGDKFANRYGGKGCVKIVPKEEMPILPDGRRVMLCFNTSGVPNRENAGQIFETSINMRSNQLINYLKEHNELSTRDKFEMIIEFLRIVAPKMAEEYNSMIEIMDYNEGFDSSSNNYFEAINESKLEQLMTDILSSECLYICQEPVTETMDLDKIKALDETFPFMYQVRLLMPMRDSNNNIRFVPCRREMTVGYQYIYRMKQYASEKFSVTSLASTNMKNLPTRNSLKKSFRTLHSSTPVSFNSMETFDLLHIGPEYVVCNLLLNSLSPHARRLTEQLTTGNPYDIDIKLDDSSSNRSVEILNAYMMVMGLEIKFMRKPKKSRNHVLFNPISFTASHLREVIFFDVKDSPIVGYVDKLVDNMNTHVTFDNIWFED